MLFRVVNNTLNPRIALFFLMAMVFSPGMFHASASFLPSSFAMYTTMFGMAQFMNWRGGLKTAQGIFCFALGGILGWPFAMALSAPFLFEEVVFACLSSKDAFIETILRFIRGIVSGLIVLVGSLIYWGYCSDLTRYLNSSYLASSTRLWYLFHSISSGTTYSASLAKDQRSMVLSHGISTSVTCY